MGGTIAKHARFGHSEVVVLCLTDGSSTQYPGDDDIRRLKQAEAVEAGSVLGVSRYIQKDLPDMKLDGIAHVTINQIVQDAVSDLTPDTVYVVHPDLNMDHCAVFRSVMVATRPRRGTSVKRVLSYGPISSVEWTAPFESSFRPNWFSDITATLELKLAAFECYTTETRPWPHPRSARAIRAYAEAYGASTGCEYAEPFVLIRNLCT
jgi:LmbE family N-acetylglucosaminyl deacetylase